MTQLIYIADPMCSWCYGFGPELQQILQARPEARLELICGGLRSGATEILSAELRDKILQHWQHVQEASGLPFDAAAMQRPGWIYNTEPACRAWVTAAMLADHLSARELLPVFHAIQQAFYAGAKDVTDPQVLAEVSVAALNQLEGEGAYDVGSFLETLQSPMAMETTQLHFQQCHKWGVRAFPALLMVHNDALHMIASGYAKAADMLAVIQQLEQTA